MRTLTLLLLLMCWVEPDAVRIAIEPHVVMVGGSVRIRCTVSPHAENQWLEVIILEYSGSGHQLDGQAAPVTYEQVFERVPCGVGPAICEVWRTTGQRFRASAALTVAGCDESDAEEPESHESLDIPPLVAASS